MLLTLNPVVAQSLSRVWLRPHGRQHARLPRPFPSSQSLLKLMSIELVMPSNHVILCHPLLLLPSVFPSISVFSNDLALPIWWPKYFYALNAGNRCEWINLITSIPLLTTFQSQLSCFLVLQLRSSFPPWGEGGEVSAWTTPAWNPPPPPRPWNGQLLSPLCRWLQCHFLREVFLVPSFKAATSITF